MADRSSFGQVVAAGACLLIMACGDAGDELDASVVDAAELDAQVVDAAELDALVMDAPATDASPDASDPVDVTDAGVTAPSLPAEFTPVRCAGPTLTGEEMFTLFPPTLNRRFLGNTLSDGVAITRSCSTVTGCSEWTDAVVVRPPSEFRTVAPRSTFQLLDVSGAAADTTANGMFIVSSAGSYLHQRFAPGDDPSTICKEVLVYTDVATSPTSHRETWSSSRAIIPGPLTTSRTYRTDPFPDFNDPLTAWCPGATTNADIIAAWFPAGSELVNITGAVEEVVPRTRRCDDLTGCTPFAENAPPVRYYATSLQIASPSSLLLRVIRRVGTSVNVIGANFPLSSGSATGTLALSQIAGRVTGTCAVVRSRYDLLLSDPPIWEQTYAIHVVRP